MYVEHNLYNYIYHTYNYSYCAIVIKYTQSSFSISIHLRRIFEIYLVIIDIYILPESWQYSACKSHPNSDSFFNSYRTWMETCVINQFSSNLFGTALSRFIFFTIIFIIVNFKYSFLDQSIINLKFTKHLSKRYFDLLLKQPKDAMFSKLSQIMKFLANITL